MTRWFWLSFADTDLPEGEQFLGVAIVGVTERSIEFFDEIDPTDGIQLLRERGQEDDVPFYTAVQTAHFAKLNPGGSVQGFEITDRIDKIPTELRMKLLSKAQLDEAGLA